MKKLLILLSILLMCGVANAATETHYVCPNGSGAGDTDGSSWANCWDGFSDITWGDLKADDGLLGPDDDLLLRDDDGVYRERFSFSKSGSDGEPITIKADTGESPILLGSLSADNAGSWTDEGNDHWSCPVVKNDPGNIFLNTETDTITVGNRESNINCDLCASYPATSPLDTQWDFCWDGTNKEMIVFNTQSPDESATGIEVPVATQTAGLESIIYINGKSNVTVSNIGTKYGAGQGIKTVGTTVSDITLRKDMVSYCGAQDMTGSGVRYGGGIQIGGRTISNILIDGCTVYEVWDGAIGWEGLQDNDSISNFTIKDCTAYNNCNAINFHGYSGKNNISISDILITNNNFRDSGSGWGGNGQMSGDGLHFMNQSTGAITTNVIIRWNYIRGSAGKGAYITDSANVTLRYNDISSNGLQGIYVAGGTNECTGTYSCNFIYDNERSAILIYENQAALYLYNNIFYENSTGGNYYELELHTNTTGVIGKNNIIVNSTRYVIHVDATADGTFDYNCFDSGHATPWYWQGSTYATLALYQAASSQDAHSIDADPKMVDPADGNFKLLKDSPCVNAGISVGINNDYNGHLINQTRPDIGAYERKSKSIMLRR